MYHNSALALFLVRILLGATCIAHGSQKLFGLFGGHGLHAFVQYTSSLGYPTWMGYLAALFEFVGGVMVLLGIYAQLGAALLIPIMFVAIYSVHLSSGYFVQTGGYEYALNLLILAIAIIVGGPGAYSVRVL